ncbi:MerR family transcriptional regulator [Ruania suaedae]|uniref:MerR family transcriptional regulator n=1 Tax=Ruania suaedae TaxID=2897774 RepID=UPI001E4D7826|nr:MerR family transcriptional regulator [Ruania suaedae]UFU01970.1 MerR family transcriptional regulator [Ruania suaedae]
MRVGELARRTGVSVRSLRYYENQGLLAPSRSAAGQRIYGTEHETIVGEIQELFRAGFCSSVIRELLPALTAPVKDTALLGQALTSARERLTSEKRAIDAELLRLEQWRDRWGLAPDTHVSVQDERHDDTDESSPPAPPDHRDRRLR